MRYVRIENNIVVEIGEFDSIENRFHPSLIWIQSDTANIGDVYSNNQFAKPSISITIVQIKEAKLTEINNACNQQIEAIKATYPENEVSSWDKQEREAIALLTDATASTPLIDSIAQARGVDRVTLAGKIIEKSKAFAQVSGSLIGKRQALEDQLNAIDLTAADAVDKINAIHWQ